MEAACQRFCDGDISSLFDIVNFIDARKSHENHRLGTRTLTAIINLLIQEGAELRRAHGKDYGLPSPPAFFATRVLAQVGTRQSEEGSEVQRALLVLGLQRCRDLCLDAYFGLGRAQRYYVIMFVKLLTMLYGCTPQDLLHNETSINMLTGCLEAGQSAQHSPGAVSLSETAARASPQQHAGSTSGNIAGSGPSRGSHARSPPPPRDGAPNSSRPSNIQNRSALLVSIPGVSFDMPLRATRGYRDLPKKPINAPFAVNPLYEDASSPGGEGNARDTNVISRPDSPVSPSPGLVTVAYSAAPEITIPAQFPTPVVLFSSYYGLGCVPRLPTTDDLARLDAWRQESQQLPRPPRDLQKSIIKTGKGFAESGDAGREFGRMRLAALRCSTPGPTSEAETPTFLVHNEDNFAPANTAAAPYQRLCRQSLLLQQYIDHGKLLSWGSAAKGALGPSRQRRPLRGFDSSDRPAAIAPPPAPPTKASAPLNNPATTAAQKQNAPGKATASEAKPNKIVPTATNTHSNHDNSPPTTVEKAPTPLTSTRAVSSGPQGYSDVAATPTATHAQNGPHRAPSSPSGCEEYVYLPTPVYTTARVAAIACGLSVTYVVTTEGVLYSCGRGENGQLGIGMRSLRYAESGTSCLQRVLLKEDETVTRVAAGTACAVALAGDDTLYCWGHNVYGQCVKLPDLSRVLTPVRLRTCAYKVRDICFGQFFGVLLFDDGGMGTWGIASMLGVITAEKAQRESLAPDQCKCARHVVRLELETDCPMAAVRAGPWHALAISKRGEVYTWGVGRGGRLGHGTDGAEVKPRLVQGLSMCYVVDASCASAHTAVLTSSGSVYVFGENAEGQLGLRGRSPRRLPMALPLPGKAVAVACAREHTCVLLQDGDVVACGSYRTSGVGLGYGTRLCAPVRILTNYVSLTLQCGHFHSLAGALPRRTALMTVGCSTIDEVSRILSVVVRSGVRCAASGVGFLVVLSENNSLVSIGRGERGQLGIGDCMKPASSDDVTVTPKFTPVQLPSGVVIQHLRCGPDYVVALDQNGAVYGWGSNERQKLGQPLQVDYVYTPVRLSGYGQQQRIVQVACGGTFMIALTGDGDVLTHGEATYCGLGRELRDSRKLNVSTPTAIPSLRDIVAIAAGRRHAIAMTASCNIYAWGVGVLGCGAAAAAVAVGRADSVTSAAFTPVRVALTEHIRTIGCGAHNSFAITDDGALWVWGVNMYGECGVPPSCEGGAHVTAAGSTPQQPDGMAAPEDAVRVMQTPICVARQVRDAAFTSQFGLAVFEDGQVRVSGRVRHGGRKYFLPTFHSDPQPHFSIEVNEPVRGRWQGESSSMGSSQLSRVEAAAAAISAAPAPPTHASKREVVNLGDEDEDDADEEGDDSSSTLSSVGSGRVSPQMHPSASARLPPSSAGTAAALPVQRASCAAVAESRRSPLKEVAQQELQQQLAPKVVSPSRESTGAPPRPSSSDDHTEPPVGVSARASAEPPTHTTTTPTITPASNPRLPPVRPSTSRPHYDEASTTPDWKAVMSSSTGAAPRLTLASPHAPFIATASKMVKEGEVFVPLPSAPRTSHLRPTAVAGAAREAAEAAAPLRTSSVDCDAAAETEAEAEEDFLDSVVQRAALETTHPDRGASSAADVEGLLLFPLETPWHEHTPRVSETPAAEATFIGSSSLTSLPLLPRPPPTPPPAPLSGAARPAQPPTKTAPNVALRVATSLPAATANSVEAKTFSSRPANTGVPTRNDGAKSANTPTTNTTATATATATAPIAAAAEEKRVFGIRCFAGWEQICVVMEKHRPVAKEVRMAQDGLKVLLHEPRSGDEMRM
ncbi:hypothetical protein ABB37_00860 [Leptomonas pyrrhocoris]|uniref:Uncharacterized protein n=1 Tax=Leptomonas pyrrhocoris TaxID=157538 RepID=A0A0M9GBK8_LEPPY|nr:hypothetical protein ABB37_00860 [Leptomonas pyrrhocoris]KPA86796.1 hypothetical protein ABB37_00860 [Leptomonas pyrrhocoris]|eukprot:XP_015665235.1 hypothetical protein ABB37_00860 [Leptomonas pyrrhocoris]